MSLVLKRNVYKGSSLLKQHPKQHETSKYTDLNWNALHRQQIYTNIVVHNKPPAKFVTQSWLNFDVNECYLSNHVQHKCI